MQFNEETQEYTYPCPCGDRFIIHLEELYDGEDVAPCPSCTLRIRIIFDEDSLPPLRDEEEDEDEDRDGDGGKNSPVEEPASINKEEVKELEKDIVSSRETVVTESMAKVSLSNQNKVAATGDGAVNGDYVVSNGATLVTAVETDVTATEVKALSVETVFTCGQNRSKQQQEQQRVNTLETDGL